MLVRLAAPEDAEDIGRIRVKAWQAAYRDVMPRKYLDSLDPRANLDELGAILRSSQPSLVVRVVQQGGDVVAFSILGRPRFQASDDTLELWAVNVEPRHWSKGVGRALVRQSLDDARSGGATTLELWCIPTNRRACGLYESCGFVLTGQDRTTLALTGHPLHEVAYRTVL